MYRKILLVSYSDCKFDGRLRELKKVCALLGDCYSVIRKTTETDSQNFAIEKTGIPGIVEFIKKSINITKSMNIDVVLLDNRMSSIPGIFIRFFCPKVKIIQDVRELYLRKERNGLKSKIGCLIEKHMIKRADVVICANEYRAKVMEDIYQLKRTPIVYENLRMLSYAPDTDFAEFEKKYAYLNADTLPIVISTSGVEVHRTNDKLTREFSDLKGIAKLLMVGGGCKQDWDTIKEIIQKYELDNVYLVDKIPEDELKYLVSLASIGVVNYGMYDTNNTYCASGKVYEFLYDQIPVVTTENPPLKGLCEKYQVGVSGKSYADSIKQVLSNYDYYKDNIETFWLNNTIEENNIKLKNEIETILRGNV